MSVDYASVWDGFESVSVRISREQRTLKEMCSFVSKRAAIEEAYAKSLQKLAKEKLGSGEEGSFANALQSLREEAEDRGKVHLEFSTSLKNESKSLEQFFNAQKKNTNSTLTSGLKMTKNLANSKIDEAKAKDVYFSTAKQGESDPKYAKKVDEADKNYRKKVEVLKTAQSTLYSGMPSVLQLLQSADEQILDRIESCWNSYSSWMDLMTPTLSSLASIVKRTCGLFNRVTEMQLFQSSIYSGEERPPLAEYRAYGSPEPVTQRTMSPPQGVSSPNMGGSRGQPMGGGGPPQRGPPMTPMGGGGPKMMPGGGGGGRGKKVPVPNSRISMLMNASTDALVNDKSFHNVYDNDDFVDKQLEAADSRGGGGGTKYRAQVLYDWIADDPEAISIKAGEVIEVKEEESGWMFGTSSKGKYGRFPASYAQYI